MTADRVRRALEHPGDDWAGRVAAGGLASGLPSDGAEGSMAQVAEVAGAVGHHPEPVPYQSWLVGPALVLSRRAASGDLAEAVATGAARTALVAGAPVTAVRRPGGWVLDGRAPLVPFAAGADRLLVVAHPDRPGRPSPVLAVPLGAGGLGVTAVASVGDDRSADLAFEAVAAGDDDLAAELADDDRQWVADRRAVAAAAEMVGSAAAALALATAHADRRRQFGQPVGAFQAVAHRLADALVSLSVAADAVADAADRLDTGAGAARAVHGCGALVAGCCRSVVAAAHQSMGGAGLDAGSPLHRWLRRVHALAPVLGTPAAHRAALADTVLGRHGPPDH
ncbi:MAG: acyl-CoA dehydrogenase family protein [Acidimicrobiales bacterium]